MATVVFLASAYLGNIASKAELTALSPALLLTSGIQRSLLSLGVATAVLLALAAILPSAFSTGHSDRPRTPAAIHLFAAIVWLLLPVIYIRARCQHDATRAADFVEQSRLGEALPLLQRLLILSPRQHWNSQPLHQQIGDIARSVREIESRIALPLPAEVTDDDRLSRARDLAILGKTHDAEALLRSSTALAKSADANNLLGTIHETRGEWESGRQSYERARLAWESQPPSTGRTNGLIRAITGIAFCHRKLGHTTAAETAYQELLTLSPTAETHFLLARFYDDTEQATKARTHAEEAATLDPSRYQQPARALLDNLSTRHFSCLTQTP